MASVKSGLKGQSLYGVCSRRKTQRLSQMNTLMKAVRGAKK